MFVIAELLEVYSSAILKLQTKLDDDQPASLASIRYYLAEFLVGLRDLFLPQQLNTSSWCKAATKLHRLYQNILSVPNNLCKEGQYSAPLSSSLLTTHGERAPGLSAVRPLCST